MKQLVIGLSTLALVLAFTTTAQAACEPDSYVSGDLLIVEIFPNASGDDANKEWIEVYNNAACSKNLKGLTIKWKKPDNSWGSKVIPAEVAAIASRSRVMLGQYPGKTPAYDLARELSLKDATGEVQILKDSKIIDKIDYKGVIEGQSIFRPLAWTCKPPDCVQQGEIAPNSSDFGSPGSANPSPYTSTIK